MTRIDALMLSLFFFNDTATTEIYTLSLHDALPISRAHFFFLPRTARSGKRRDRPSQAGKCTTWRRTPATRNATTPPGEKRGSVRIFTPAEINARHGKCPKKGSQSKKFPLPH